MKKDSFIVIDARRWFDKKWGNTYHSVQVTDRNTLIGEIPFAYGYGESYLQSAHKILQDSGYFTKSYDDFLQYMRNNRNKFYVTVADVQRKKDL